MRRTDVQKWGVWCMIRAKAGVFREVRRTGRALERHDVEALHVGDVDAQELTNRLMEENCADAIFSGPPNNPQR